jgi:hypothetical protein
MWLCYGIQQTDKTSIATQALYGMRADTKLVGNQYAMLSELTGRVNPSVWGWKLMVGCNAYH